MSCRKARRALRKRIDERLPIEVEFQLDAHLERCAACRAAEARALQLEEALARLPEPATERLDVEHSVQVIRARIEKPGEGMRGAPAGRRWPILRLAAAAAALILVGFLLFELAGEENPGPVDPPENVAGGAPEERPEGPAPREDELAAEDSGVNRERLEATREEVRALLAECGGELPEGATRDEAIAFAELLDERTARLRRQEWPVRRIVEGMLESDNLAAARAAARYLGVRGDSRSRRQLVRALDRAEIAAASTRALGDAGAEGLEGLGDALAHREVRAIALEGIARIGGEEAAATLAEVLFEEAEASEGLLTPSEDLLATLLELGEHAVEPLIELGERDWLSREELFATMEGLAGIESYFDQQLAWRSRKVPTDLVLAGAVRFAPDTALSWCVDNLYDRRRGELAALFLPWIPGELTVDALIGMRSDARLGSAELEQMTTLALEVDGERFARQAGFLVDRERKDDATELAELLLAASHPGTGETLTILASPPLLDPAIRQAAVLAVGEWGAESDLPALLELFATLGPGDRYLASACLISIEALGGETACRSALAEVAARPTQNILSLLHRRKASEGKNPSIYKLARELKPILADRARDNRRFHSS